jgi:hypothetical protein
VSCINATRYRARRLLLLACCLIPLVGAPAGAQPAAGEPNVPSLAHRLLDRLDRALSAECLTPAAGRVLSDLIAAGRLEPVLQSELTFAKGAVGSQQIELEIRDQAQRPYGVTLALPGTKVGTPDGQGARFLFYLSASPGPPNPRATRALLAAAVLFDGAIPDTALGRCAGGDESHTDRRYPRTIALASAMVEVSIIVAAIVFGLFAIRPRREAARDPST